jgi:hypothetical protein
VCGQLDQESGLQAVRPELERFGAVRDPRQLYALDRRSERVVYLPEGAADAFRTDCDAGHLVCPVRGCAEPSYLAVGGVVRRHHFRHRVPGVPAHSLRSWSHLTAKLALGQHLRDRYPDLQVTVNEEAADGGDEPDLTIVAADGRHVAVEIQYARLTLERWRERHEAYAGRGISDVWVFGHLPPHFRRPRHEQQEEVVQLGALLRFVAAEGLPVYFIDPDRHELATAMIERRGGDGKLAELAVDPIAEIELEGTQLLTPGERHELAARAERERERQLAAARASTRPPPGHETQHDRLSAPLDVLPTAALPEWPRQPVEPAPAREAADAAWERAKPAFLTAVGLEAVPEIVTYESAADEPVGLAPAHWHARLIYRFIEGRIGKTFSPRDAAALLTEPADPDTYRVDEAVSLYLFHLRRSGYLHFEQSGRDIRDPVTVLADLKHPPSARLAQLARGGAFVVRLAKSRGRLVAVSYEGELLADLRALRGDETEGR